MTDDKKFIGVVTRVTFNNREWLDRLGLTKRDVAMLQKELQNKEWVNIEIRTKKGKPYAFISDWQPKAPSNEKFKPIPCSCEDHYCAKDELVETGLDKTYFCRKHGPWPPDQPGRTPGKG